MAGVRFDLLQYAQCTFLVVHRDYDLLHSLMSTFLPCIRNEVVETVQRKVQYVRICIR